MSGKDVATVKLWWMVPLVGCMIALFVAGPRYRVGIFGIDKDPVVFRNPPREEAKDKQQDGWFLASWKDQTLTLHHRGYMYRARCEKTVYPGNSGNHTFSNCNNIIEFIGSTLPNAMSRFDPGYVSANKYVTDVSDAGGSLIIKTWFDPDGPEDLTTYAWTQTYSIDEVSPLPPGDGSISPEERKKIDDPGTEIWRALEPERERSPSFLSGHG